MRKLLLVGAGLAVVCFSVLALSQAVPYPSTTAGGGVLPDGGAAFSGVLQSDAGLQVGGNGNLAVYLGEGPLSTSYAGVWIGQSAASATTSNFTLLSSSSLAELNVPTGGTVYLGVGNNGYFACTSTQCSTQSGATFAAPAGITVGSAGTAITVQVLGNCTMATGTTCSVADTGVSATSTISCVASGATVGTLASVTGVIVTAGTSYQVNANAANSDTWRCVRWN